MQRLVKGFVVMGVCVRLENGEPVTETVERYIVGNDAGKARKEMVKGYAKNGIACAVVSVTEESRIYKMPDDQFFALATYEEVNTVNNENDKTTID